MALQQDQSSQNLLTKPLILLHTLPKNIIPYLPLIQTRFTILDPSNGPDPLSQSVRVILCVGPTPLPANTINQYPSLELIVCGNAGVEHIDLAECRRRRIRVTNAGDAFSDDVADCAVGLLIDVLRRVSAADRFVRAKSWRVEKEFPLGFKVGKKRIGIVGLGSIGLKISKRLEAFGCLISYHSRKMKADVSFPYYNNVLDLATNNDVLVICCALTSLTHHIINKDVMTALGKQGVIINVGRGGLIDEQRLVEFLVRGELAGAGLDVFENEPNVPEELFKLDNVVLSPHKAVATPGSFEALGDVVISNLDAFFSNKPLLSEIKLE